MKFNKSLIAILAILLVVFSACAVSATEDVAVVGEDDADPDEDAVVGDENNDEDEDYGEGGEGAEAYIPDVGSTGPGLMDEENSDLNIPLGSDSPDNQTESSASGTPSASSNLDKNAAGNPVLVLLVVLAVLGTFSIRRK